MGISILRIAGVLMRVLRRREVRSLPNTLIVAFTFILLSNASGQISLTCNPSAGPTTVFVNYTTTCTVSGGLAPYSFFNRGALPAGMSAATTSATTGTISGTPTQAGTYSFGFSVQDSANPKNSTTVTLDGTIAPGQMRLNCNPSIGPTTVGVGYSTTCTASGRVPPYTFFTKGTLPAGLNALTTSATTETIGGTPTQSGSYSFDNVVQESANPTITVTTTFSGTIAAPPPADPFRLASSFQGLVAPPGDPIDIPDPMIVAGPSSLILINNRTLAIVNKNATTLASSNWDTFLSSLPPSGVTDPYATFDRSSGRFFIIISCGTRYCLAVSKSSTPTTLSSADWYFYAHTRAQDPAGIYKDFADHDHIALNESFAVITFQAYTNTVPLIGLGGAVRILDKSKLIAGQAISSWVQFNVPAEPVPAAHLGNPPTIFLVDGQYPCGYTVWGIDGIPAQPVISSLGVPTSIKCQNPYAGAVQPGNTGRVDASSPSVPVFRDGYLWSARSTGIDYGNGAVAAIHWAQIDVHDWPRSVHTVQEGILGSPDTQNFDPGIAVDESGNMVVVHARSSASEYVSLYYAGRSADSPPGTIGASHLIRAGEAVVNDLDGSTNRFGDYFTASLDIDGTFWITGQYARSAPGFGTWIANIAITLQPQSITFGTVGNTVFGAAPFLVNATSTSGLSVNFVSATPAVCLVSATTITILAAGSCSITANQAGNSIWAVAAPVTQSFTVAKAVQNVSFPSLPDINLDARPFSAVSIASSGLTVAFSTSTSSVCTVTGSLITPVAQGTCSVTASQIGNSNYLPASSVTQNFRIVAAGAPLIKRDGIAPIYSSSTAAEPGSWLWIFGSTLAQTTRTWNSSTEIINGNLPTSLDGVSVSINNKPAYIYYISPSQISVQSPDDTATGPVDVVVTNSAGRGNTATVTLGPVGPSFFTYGDQYALGTILNPAGFYGPNVYDLLGPSGRYAFNTRPVKSGEVVSLFGTGFGATNPPTPAGIVISPPYGQTIVPITVTIGGVQQTVNAYVSAAGEWQMNVTIPNLPSGDQRLQAIVGGLQTPNNVLIAIQ